jgi:hypothetical protein
MRLRSRQIWFLAFTAVYAVLASFVFWGTWSMDVAPVMPDAPVSYPFDQMRRVWMDMVGTGRFIPDDIKAFLGSPYFWQELQYAFALYMAALGMVYYCRGRDLGRPAAYSAGLLLAFSGYWMTLFSAGHLGWFRWMTYGVFAFGLADRAVRKGKIRHWLLLGAVVSWASFNQQDLWLLFTVFTFFYFVWCCIRERKLPWRGALAALAVFVLIGAPNFYHSIFDTLKSRKEQIASGQNITAGDGAGESERRWEFVTNWSMPPEDTLEFVFAREHGDTSCPIALSISRRLGRDMRPYVGRLGRPLNAERGNYRQHSLYVGYVTCLLAVLGALTAWKRERRLGEVAFFVAVGAFFYGLSLGRFLEPLYRIVFLLPFGDLIRCPVKWHHLTELCLVVLAAHGIDWAWRRLSPPWRAALAAVVLWGVVDLAIEDRRFCVPMDVSQARKLGAAVSPTFLSAGDFSRPEVAAMMQAGRLVSLANYPGSKDVYLVEVLKDFGPPIKRDPSLWTYLAGMVSLISTASVAVYSIRRS